MLGTATGFIGWPSALHHHPILRCRRPLHLCEKTILGRPFPGKPRPQHHSHAAADSNRKRVNSYLSYMRQTSVIIINQESMQRMSKHQHRKTLRGLICADLPLTVTVTEALVLSELHQISTNFNNFWHNNGKGSEIM